MHYMRVLRKRRNSYRANVIRGDFFVVSHIKKFITKSLKKYIKDKHIIGDVGCGEQPFRKMIEGFGGKYVGVDLAQNSQNSVDIIGSITNLPVEDNYFDIILCSEVLEHVFDLEKGLKELFRSLKPGGILILTIPFNYPLHEEPFDYYRFTSYWLKEKITSIDRKILAIEKGGNEFELIATVIDNFWYYLLPQRPLYFWKLLHVCMRVFVNFLIYPLTKLFGKYSPKKFYLSNMIVVKN